MLVADPCQDKGLAHDALLQEWQPLLASPFLRVVVSLLATLLRIIRTALQVRKRAVIEASSQGRVQVRAFAAQTMFWRLVCNCGR